MSDQKNILDFIKKYNDFLEWELGYLGIVEQRKSIEILIDQLKDRLKSCDKIELISFYDFLTEGDRA